MRVILLSLIIFISACADTNEKILATETVKTMNDSLVGIDEKVSGKFLHEYANIWWQWTRTMNNHESPVRDLVGDKCSVNQSGNVWFLAGGYGSSKINRKCIIPEGKHIFFPIINMAYWPRRGGSPTCESVKNGAALNNENVLSINVELDGEIIPEAKEYRIKSNKCFDLFGLIPKEHNARKVFPSATDGYWLMLKPLSKGKHNLKFSAQYNRVNGSFGKMAQDIEYEIEVK
jgi:hypothetical protein